MRKNANKYVPKYAKFLFTLAILSYVVLFVGRRSSAFAEWISSGIGYYIRSALARISSIAPVSIGEILLVLSPLIVISVVLIAAKKSSIEARMRFLSGFLAIVSIFYTGYVFTLGIGYNRTPIEDRLSMKRVEVNAQNLYDTAEFLRKECELLLDEVEFSDSGSSVSGISFEAISDEAILGYQRLQSDFPSLNIKTFDSAAKPVYFSKVMTKLDLLGVYTYFTGEANVNVHYPDYTTPFTVAHEMAHQRGISREDEANFTAFLVCARADNVFVRYSGYMNMLEYVASALYKTDKQLYRELISSYDDRLKAEINAYREFYYANKNDTLGKLSESVNDNYLKAQGTEGTISYGLVVRLCVSYYESLN